jgi:hypothetical protein
VGRVEINHAGLAAFAGPKGKKCIANLSWEKLFVTLSKWCEESAGPLTFELEIVPLHQASKIFVLLINIIPTLLHRAA